MTWRPSIRSWESTFNFLTLICQVKHGFGKQLKLTKEAVRQYCFNALLTVGNKPNKLEVMTSQKPKRQGKQVCTVFLNFFFIKCILAKVD